MKILCITDIVLICPLRCCKAYHVDIGSHCIIVFFSFLTDYVISFYITEFLCQIWLDETGHQTMEMNGGSSAPYLASTSCVPLFCTLFHRGGNRRALRLPGAGGDHFRCTVEPSPGHVRCRELASNKSCNDFGPNGWNKVLRSVLVYYRCCTIFANEFVATSYFVVSLDFVLLWTWPDWQAPQDYPALKLFLWGVLWYQELQGRPFPETRSEQRKLR